MTLLKILNALRMIKNSKRNMRLWKNESKIKINNKKKEKENEF